MQTIHVNLGEHAYDIEIGAGILDSVGDKVAALLPKAKRAVIISDTNVAPLYAQRLSASLCSAGIPNTTIIFEAGEGSKNLETLSNVLEQIAESGMTRTDVLLTLGGGVVGDLGGFAAASFMRGINFVQVPTSLLAQIDSSVGGKVAVDLKAGKNLAGAFHQPKAVFIDTDLLNTLPVHFLHDGLAEAIKHGAILDKPLFEFIANLQDDSDLYANIEHVVAECVRIKARIVEEDEFDTGIRMLLNFGHTLGHAVEQYYGYSHFTHGEGVAIGMYEITKRTEALGITSPGCAEQIKNVLQKFNLPIDAGVDKSLLLETMAHDKKKNGSKISLVLLESMGKATYRKIDFAEIGKYYLE